ncbi:MAG: N-acetyltransferase, partial [Egibacteraceae bacterium]
VSEGASIGARAVVIAGVAIGRWALVGAGAVVTRDVADHALVVGVPARQVGWVGRAGVPLVPDGDGRWRCPQDGTRYAEQDGRLVPR